MNLFQRIKAALTNNRPLSTARSFFIPRRQAGMVVNHDTALTYSAVWRAMTLISQSISTLPWTFNQREVSADGTTKNKTLYTHPAAPMLSLLANDEMSAQAWRECMLMWALSWGNGYSEIERDRANRPVALWPIEPERVTPDRDESGALVYRVRNNGRADTVLPAADMFHLRGPSPDGIVGYSVIGYAARTIGLGLATEQFGSSFFENGASFNGVFSHPEAIGPEAVSTLRQSIADNHATPGNAMKPLILEEGMTWTPTSIPPDDAQFIETRKFNVLEVARWYGVPPHKLMEMEKSTFNNIEHQSIEFVQDALMPWIKRLETEADIKLVSPAARARTYTKVSVNALLRGDLATRKEWYKTMSNLGVYSVNEIRAYEDENPIGPDGDKRLVQMNQTTLEKIGEEPETPPAPPPNAPGEENEEEMNDDIPVEDDAPTPAQRALIEVVDRVQRREHHRAVDALKRYDGDRAGLLAWMDKFYDQHQDYMRANIYNALEATGIDARMTLPGYIDKHINVSRLAILDAFDNAQPAPDFIPADVETSELVGGAV